MVLTQPDIWSFLWEGEFSFHTTMVLTQPIIPINVTTSEFEVSIPLWFSRNEKFLDLDSAKKMYVSIPLWFSRNKNRNTAIVAQWLMFPYHYGSHAT